jgi:hypothetical protein
MSGLDWPDVPTNTATPCDTCHNDANPGSALCTTCENQTLEDEA